MQNANIKRLLQLQQKSAERRRTKLFVTEGQRELQHCIEAGYEIDTIFWCEQIKPQLPFQSNRYKILRVSDEVYAKIAYRGTTEGVVAQVVARQHTLADIQLSDNPLVIVIESVEKPGNIGAVLRTADAANADAVIVCDPLTDIYNPNLLRSSLGAAFTTPFVACYSDECVNWLKTNNIQILTAQLQDAHYYYDTDMTRPTAIVMGTESTGLTNQWRTAADSHIKIPMLGHLDSLNVAVSAAILTFEAVRQRMTINKKR